jgi:hypothetical protein
VIGTMHISASWLTRYDSRTCAHSILFPARSVSVGDTTVVTVTADQGNGKSITYERSNGVPGCDPPIVCAKLVIGILLDRAAGRPELPIGPPPNAHDAALFTGRQQLAHSPLLPDYVQYLQNSLRTYLPIW